MQNIPEGWKRVRLDDLGAFSKGAGITKDDLLQKGIPCVRYGELYTKYNFIIKNCFSFIPEEIAKTSKLLLYADILFAGSGETREEIGKCAAYIGKESVYAGGDNIIFSPKKILEFRLCKLLFKYCRKKTIKSFGARRFYCTHTC